MNDSLDIIIAVTDEDENRIKRSVESALSQTYENVKILICSDSTSDETKKILSEYEKKNNVEICFAERNSACGGAFNAGLLKSQSDWISFLYEGDELSSDFAKKLLEEAVKNNADVSAAGYIKKKSNNGILDEDTDYNIEADILKEAVGELDYDKHALLCVNPGIFESKIYKREIFEKNGLWFPEETGYEKLGIERLSLLCANGFAFCEEKLYTKNKSDLEITEDMLYERLDVMSFFMEETYKREFLEDYPEEVESAFVDEMYIKTLFAFIAITSGKKRNKEFLDVLRESILDCFPEFETNPYYYEKYDDDIKELIELHINNPKKFYKQISNMKLS